MAQKMFTKGWKFDMFNVQGQINKQLCSVATIFAMVFFSLAGIVQSSDHRSFAIIVLAYSLICLFSFLNLTYVRDFDCIQVNFTPMVLSIAGVISLH